MMNAKRSSGYNLTRYVFLVPAVVVLLLIFSFSKAEVSKKSFHAIKASITTAISNARLINFDKPVVAATVSHAKKNAAISVPKAKTSNTDTIYVGKSKSKDGKNKSFTLIGNANPDSVNYVINGVKATRADLKAMDPARIYSLDMMPAEKAKEFFPELSNNQRVLFVTTDDSETGKKLKEKMDKTMGGGTLARARTMTVTANGSSDHDPVVISGTGISISGSSDEAPMAVGSNDNVTSVMVVTDPKVATRAIVKKDVYVTGSPKATYILKEDGDAPDVVYFDSEDSDKKTPKHKTYTFKDSPRFRVNGFVSNNGSSINNFGDKLIVIDGKVASEKQMKNLKITDIKSLTEKVDDATKEKYGDKAKNGVLFITPKK
jgi:hypothetical protein